jgi:hypothetical protein
MRVIFREWPSGNGQILCRERVSANHWIWLIGTATLHTMAAWQKYRAFKVTLRMRPS